MTRPTLAPGGVLGVLVPWGNTTTQLEVEPLTPAGAVNAVARFNFGPGVDLDAELSAVAEKISYAEPDAILLSLSPEMGPDGFNRARALEDQLSQSAGVPAFTTTLGTTWKLEQHQLERIALIGPATPERLDAAAENFRAEGFDVATALAMDVGLANIKSTPLAAIGGAFRAADAPGVEAFVQVGTGLPAFAIADEMEKELGRPVITTGAAGYAKMLHAIGSTVTE